MTVDQALRDRAAREIDTSWALSAGAGSGKTGVLVCRTVELLAAALARKKLSFLDSAGLSLKGAGAAPLEQLAGDALRAAQTLERCIEHGFWPATGEGTALSLEREAKLALLDRDALEQILEGIER